MDLNEEVQEFSLTRNLSLSLQHWGLYEQCDLTSWLAWGHPTRPRLSQHPGSCMAGLLSTLKSVPVWTIIWSHGSEGPIHSTGLQPAVLQDSRQRGP